MLEDFLAGAVSMGFAVAALQFIRFWRKSGEQLFLIFASSFALQAVNQVMLTLTEVPLEERSRLYLVRLAAFMLIIFGVWHHNRRNKPRA
jgi:hypothetical protein